MKTPWEYRFASRTKRISSSIIREILKFAQVPGMISFAGGLPAPDVFPVEEINLATNRVLEEHGPQALQYSTTEGYVPLREMIVELTKESGIEVTLDNVQITTGSQQALDLLGKVFINPGDRVLVESPTYLGALQAWNAYDAEYITVPVDDDGMVVDKLEEALRKSPKFIYVLPNFQNPTGVTLSLERRQRIVELADKYGVPIVEDDPYAQLRYAGEHLPSLLALDAIYRNQTNVPCDGNVIYLSTFSKILAPGLRLAWVVAPSNVIKKMVQAKQGADLHTSSIVQMIAYETFQKDFLERHVGVIRDVYGKRMQLMLDAIQKNFPSGVTWTKPQGGMFLWVTLPEEINATDLLQKAIDEKVAFVPGEFFHPLGGGKNTMRLNFSNASPDNIVEGISRLGKVLKKELAKV